MVGINDNDVPINPFMIVLWEAEMKGSFAYFVDEFKIVIKFLEQKKINTELLISETVLLDEIEEKGFKKLLSSTEAVKIMVRP